MTHIGEKMEEKDNIYDEIAAEYDNEKSRIANKYGSRSLSPISPELLKNIRAGDHAAYDEFYLDSVAFLTDFVNFLIHNESDAEEICQQIYVNIWENREAINPHSNFRGYIYMVAKNMAFKFLAHKKVRSKYKNQKLYEDPALGDSPEELVITHEIALLIKISLDNMPEQRRRVFEMSRYEGLDYDQIAERLNITNATVRSHLSKAIKELKELIALFLVFFLSQ